MSRRTDSLLLSILLVAFATWVAVATAYSLTVSMFFALAGLALGLVVSVPMLFSRAD